MTFREDKKRAGGESSCEVTKLPAPTSQMNTDDQISEEELFTYAVVCSQGLVHRFRTLDLAKRMCKILNSEVKSAIEKATDVLHQKALYWQDKALGIESSMEPDCNATLQPRLGGGDDTKRLDWLQKQDGCKVENLPNDEFAAEQEVTFKFRYPIITNDGSETLREAIDAAMRKDK